jgi:GTPase SAR1 family protein
VCIETLQHNQHENPFSNETLKTLQSLVSYGATWDAACDDMVASGGASDEVETLRRSVLLWAEEHTNGLEFSRITVRVVKRGVGSTQGFIDGLKASHEIVLRRKICLVGSSFAGKTSFVKSIISQQPQLDHLDDRTIGIDHFPLRFASRDETKIHEVTFWDFVGQDVYQVAHSLYFSPRTLFVVFVDLQAFASAYMQASIFANEVYQEAELLDEFVEQSISRWVRLICGRQLDAEFVFIATKNDVLKENKVTEMLLKDELMKNLRAVGALVEQMKEAAPTDMDTQAEVKFASIPDRSVEIGNHKTLVHFVSCVSLTSIEKARMRIEELITESERSHPMPDTYSRALEVIVKVREEAKALDNYERISRVIVPVGALSAQLNIEPGRCRSILRTLHDLGDVLWYESLGVAFFHNSVILDPLLLIDFIREIFTHK